MDIGKITAQVRPRNPNEATDLGIVMARRWYGPLLLLGVLPTLPLTLLLFFIFRDQLWWAVLILWWIKPLWETLQLHFIAEALFNPNVQWRDILRRAFTLIRHQFFAKLITQRLSLSRSFNMPVDELEQLRGTQRRRRLNILHRDASGSRIWLTLLGNAAESMLVLAVFATTWLLMPVKLEVDFELNDILESPLLFPTIVWATYGAMMLISPFYVCSGFMLYINRRTWLEAWDIELVFRQLAARITQTGKAALLIGGLCLLPLITQSSDVIASPATTFTPEQSQQAIIEILEGDDFNAMETKTGLRWRKDLLDNEPDDVTDNLLQRGWQHIETWLQKSTALQTLLNGLAKLPSLLEIILWGLFSAIIAYLLYRVRHVIGPGWKAPVRNHGRTKPSQLFGLALDQDSLPHDVLDNARTLWQSGRQREALSLLYRAALSHLVHERHVPLEASHTESECVAVCRNNSDRMNAEYFQQLTSHWIALAYAHRLPSDEHFIRLCEGWPAFVSRSDDT